MPSYRVLPRAIINLALPDAVPRVRLAHLQTGTERDGFASKTTNLKSKSHASIN